MSEFAKARVIYKALRELNTFAQISDNENWADIEETAQNLFEEFRELLEAYPEADKFHGLGFIS